MTQPYHPFNQSPRPGTPAPWPGPSQYPGQGNPTQSSFGGWGGRPPGPPPQQWGAPGQGGQFGPPGQFRPGGQFPPGGQFGPPGQFGPGPFGHPGMQPRPPAPKRPTALLAALGVAGVVLVGMLVFALTDSRGGDDVAADYQNEEYTLPEVTSRPPALPYPKTDSEARDLLEKNDIYGVTLAAPVRCETEPLADVTTVTDDELQDHLTSYVECLTRVWGPAIQEAGYTDYQPSVTVYPAGGEVSTQCGTQPSFNALYCGSDQKLYVASDIVRILPDDLAGQRIVFDQIVGHEYAHAMQGRLGIFAASVIMGSESSEAEAAAFSRRSEVQADCFGAAAMNSLAQDMQVSDADRAAMPQISYEIGDDRIAERFDIKDPGIGDHGTGANRRMWTERGLATRELGQCNSFSAPAGEVA